MLPLEERKGAGRLLKSSPFLCDCMVSKRTRYADSREPPSSAICTNDVHLLALRHRSLRAVSSKHLPLIDLSVALSLRLRHLLRRARSNRRFVYLTTADVWQILIERFSHLTLVALPANNTCDKSNASKNCGHLEISHRVFRLREEAQAVRV